MIKKYFAIAALALTLSVGTVATANAQDDRDTAVTVVAELPDGQEAVEGDWVNSTETNTVEESAIAQKMTQAEKAKNAAENDSWGGAITIIAMTIVLLALIILSLLFLGFGKISEMLLSKKKRAAKSAANHSDDHSHDDLDSGEVIAAIAAALSEHFGGNHDMEDTILTIRRMKKAYSPWSSKLYNLREYPAPSHPQVGNSALRRFNDK